MRLTFLGTGTSTGIPQLRCQCEICRSDNPLDKRLRASALLHVNGMNLLIDCGPDFRTQMLNAGDPELDALLITHTHYDHVGGIDDLRPYCTTEGFPVFCKPDVANDLRSRIPYCFAADPYPGVPHFNIHEISADQTFEINGTKIETIDINHYRLDILGYKIGNLAYITDCKKISDEEIKRLHKIDTLVINALRQEPHISHLSLNEALDVINRINPRIAYLTHLSHQMGKHLDVEPTLPSNVRIAYDGLQIEIPD